MGDGALVGHGRVQGPGLGLQGVADVVVVDDGAEGLEGVGPVEVLEEVEHLRLPVQARQGGRAVGRGQVLVDEAEDRYPAREWLRERLSKVPIVAVVR